MSDEKAVEEVVPEVVPEVTPEKDFETEARTMGWKPEAEYDGEPGKWVPAKEYVDRKPLYDQIRKLRRSQKDLEQTVNQLSSHHAKVEEVAYKRALETLKKEKAQALAEGEHNKVVELDDQISELKDSRPTQKSGPSPDFLEWVEENPWYKSDSELREEADVIGIGWKQTHPNATNEEVFEHVSKRIKRLFPDKFKNPQRAKPDSVEATRPAPVKAKEPGWDDLNDFQKAVAKKFERQGVMSVKDYVAGLVQIGEIKKGA